MTCYTHKELSQLAIAWLKRPHSKGGHGCHLALAECRSGYEGEIPDAIGWRYCGDHKDGSVVVECKTSRADFLSDRKKSHRNVGGLGNWRYFFTPEGLIKPDDLPEKWGLVEVNQRGHIKTIIGPYQDKNYEYQCRRLIAARHETEMRREMFIVVRLFHRIGDPHGINEAQRDMIRRAKLVDKYAKELREAQARIAVLEYSLRVQQPEKNISEALPCSHYF